MDYLNKWVVLKKEVFKKEYQDIKSRMFFVEGGFGARAGSHGNAIIGHHIDGESTRWEKYHVDRLATDEEIRKLVGEGAEKQ